MNLPSGTPIHPAWLCRSSVAYHPVSNESLDLEGPMGYLRTLVGSRHAMVGSAPRPDKTW